MQLQFLMVLLLDQNQRLLYQKQAGVATELGQTYLYDGGTGETISINQQLLE